MDVTVLDKLAAWAVELVPQNPGWISFGFGVYLFGAGSVCLIVYVLMSRAFQNRKTSFETNGFQQIGRDIKSFADAPLFLFFLPTLSE